MRRRIAIAALLICFGLQCSLEARGAKRYLFKESTVDMSAMKNVFLGWVDMAPDNWAVHGYGDKGAWIEVTNRLNQIFQESCRTQWLAGRTVVAAKDDHDEKAAGQDLYIKFSDVRIDNDTYYIYLSIRFINPKTSSEIASIPPRAYSGRIGGFERHLRTALDEVGQKIQIELTGVAANK